MIWDFFYYNLNMKHAHKYQQTRTALIIIAIVLFLISAGVYYFLNKIEKEIMIDIVRCDINNKIEAISWDKQETPLEILVTDDTKFYKATSDINGLMHNQYFTFEDYCSMALNGSYPWPDHVIGSEKSENTIEASDIFMIVQ